MISPRFSMVIGTESNGWSLVIRVDSLVRRCPLQLDECRDLHILKNLRSEGFLGHILLVKRDELLC